MDTGVVFLILRQKGKEYAAKLGNIFQISAELRLSYINFRRS